MISNKTLKKDLEYQLYKLPKETRKDILIYLCYMRFCHMKIGLIKKKKLTINVEIRNNGTYLYFYNRNTRFYYHRIINLNNFIQLLYSTVS